MIEIKNLSKIIDGNVILDSINMELDYGKIYGLVGRNGCGKTMLMRHILGFVYSTKGSIIIDGKVLGKDIDMPANVGAIIENPGFIPEYPGFKNLKILAAIKGKIKDQEIREAMELTGLNPDEKKHVGKYSLGMKQRLGLAQALMENPDILLLDEPMNGLDNEGVKEIREVILKRKETGNLIVIASHNEEDIKVLCDEIFYFDKGRIIE
ncbi:MAG: ATP-binding cassette domain-containing protein [Lachnospiraceae bacterium]